jgi:hypothetical protein
MNAPALILRHLCFTGPEKEPAKVDFAAGLNVVYGASDTGKSFLFEAIDFMLGGSAGLRDIPECIGYDRVFLGIDTMGGAFTLARATIGGEFQLYEGLHEVTPANVEPIVLKSKHNKKKATNISRFLLGKVELDGKAVREKKNETRSLSFRDLAHVCLVNETSIQKQGSPIETGQHATRTAEYSIFKLLLTGVDDSALVSSGRDAAAAQSRSAKIEIIDELIADLGKKLAEDGDDPIELTSQLERLEASLAREQHALQASEEEYQELVARRNQLRLKVENGADRRAEITELRARFDLLDKHYQTDLGRLEAIRESGTLLAALEPKACPLCGAQPNQQHRDESCESNLEDVVAAASAESTKIGQLRRELAETVRQLDLEALAFDRLLPRMLQDSKNLDESIDAVRPTLREKRTTYTELLEERATVNASLSLFDQLAELSAKKVELERGPEGGDSAAAQTSTDLSTTTLDLFALQVEALLKAWNFPDADRVHFERTDRDLVIHGKRRGSRGKGLRAITHAGFTLGLMEFCKQQSRQHPGFVILDSPLLAYREPEGAEDDLNGTDVQEKFYEYLVAMTERQVIIIENITPPQSIAARPSTHFFSGNPHQGRYGFFPKPDADATKNP